ncbi:MlaD family protein [Cytophagales bacterium LB-30]|uniref:MlaD family protein n=1 Tax=Shiella aurantiaca TaxID=3058365 RepID=A0ABT8F8E3_9BACT|nr:MlaD family protein [Shiella aurantiaca]MDN4166509.1 MlaD family protein [Shiella aurantiaca]
MKLSKEVKVGILAVVSISLLYLGFNFLKGIDFFSSTNTYYTQFERVDGLTVGNPIVLSGMTVGRVSKITILQGNNNQVSVEFDLDKTIVIGKGAVAKLTPVGFLGSMSIVLEPGDIAQPLSDESMIPGERNKSVMDKVQDRAFPIIDKVDSTMVDINTLLATIANKDQQIDELIDNMARFSKDLAQISGQNKAKLNEITTQLAILSQTLNDEQTGLKPLLASFNTIGDSLAASDMKGMIASLQSTLTQVDSTLAQLNDGEGTIDQLMNNDSLYTNLSNSLYSLDQLLIDMKARPKRYVHFSLFGKKEK